MITWSSEHKDALREYLGTGNVRYSDAELQRAFEVEATAQSKAVTYPDPITPDLVEALYRRVHRQIALRQYPTGTDQLTSDGGVAIVRFGSSDPEIRRLESPYRKLWAF